MQPFRHLRRWNAVRAFVITLACVILSGLAVTLMAKGPRLGFFTGPTYSAVVGAIDT